MNFILQFLPMILAAISAEESKFATSQGIALLTKENARVKAGLTDPQIAGIIGGLVALGLAEQAALVNHLISIGQPQAQATAANLTTVSRAALPHP